MEDPEKAGEIAQALDKMWARFLPEIRERVAILESAAAAFTAHELAASEREAAHAAAHKLAGVLGTFNLTRGTALAREIEVLYGGGSGSGPSLGPHLAALVAELRAVVERRK